MSGELAKPQSQPGTSLSAGSTSALFARLVQHAELILILARKEIKVRYKNNFFGYLWSLANPLASAFVFYFAFEIIFKSNIPNYFVFLIIGLFAWQWSANYLVGACTVYLANGNLIKKAVFPRFVLPIALNIQDAFHYLMSVPIIVAAIWWKGLTIYPAVVWGTLLVLPAQFLLLLGLGLALASTNLFFRDMERITQIALNMVFYLSPVLYPVDRVPPEYRIFLDLNPVTPLVETWRALFMDGTIHWSALGHAYLLAFVSLVLGSLVYRRLVGRFAETL